jgi:hypothetical protein
MATSVKRRQAWLLDPPSHRELAAVMAVGTFALVIAGIQPLLFGALVNEGRISAAGLGGAVTVEFLALASGVALASARLQPVHLRLRGLLAAMALIAANVMSMRHAAPLLYVDRGIAGFSAGVLLSIPSLLLARSRNPSKLGAVLMVLRGLVQVAFSALLPLTLMPAWGANGGFLALAGTSTLAAVFVLGVPTGCPPSPTISPMGPAQSCHRPALSLLGVVLVYAFVFGFFSYLGQIGTEAHLGSDLIGLVLAVTVAASIVGSLLTAAIAPKVSFFRIYGISVA